MVHLKRSLIFAGAALAVASSAAAQQVGQPTVIALTQLPCQFIESENGIDRGYKSKQKADCDAINAKSAAKRVAESKPIELKPGKYIFRVTNRDVPYELGFWLRERDYDWRNPLHKLSKLSVSGGGLLTGATKDYEAELAPGEYLYSCPLNTTPDYRLVVTGG